MGSVTPYDYVPVEPMIDAGPMVAAAMGMVIIASIVTLAVAILMIVAQWRIFTKAGEKGWKCLIPIYNMVVLFKIIGLSPWLLLIYLLAWIPVVGSIAVVILSIISMVKLGQAFGKSAGFIVGLIFLGPIFLLILGFGKAEYVGQNNTTASAE